MGTTYTILTQLVGYSSELRIGAPIAIPIESIRTIEVAFHPKDFSQAEIKEIFNPKVKKLVETGEPFGTVITYLDENGTHKRVRVLENLENVSRRLKRNFTV